MHLCVSHSINVRKSQNTCELCFFSFSCFWPSLEVISSHVICQTPLQTIAALLCLPPRKNLVYDYIVTYNHTLYFVTNTNIWTNILWLKHTFSLLWLTHTFIKWQSWCKRPKHGDYWFVHCWPCGSLTYIQNNFKNIYIFLSDHEINYCDYFVTYTQICHGILGCIFLRNLNIYCVLWMFKAKKQKQKIHLMSCIKHL